ncbi:hypothetical protein BU25DRAFT_453782 [Macroventuria anomochaeta]|uniref:Uncharacterized protein n=1 Tax=Macroventuria anomochaeta TaxID=301207 RepID=A0ACB6SHK2_9PLEO|nr:uncharacterized protein BU25DRAFT_453782 [Macroventuria anomochaeta]KAF2632572.1 hypothetical protein BU25DRAFT_453782 [Macroventuria anomochaeta]
MPYLVGDLIKEIEAAQENRGRKPQERPQKRPQEDWVKKKWARYYELNKMGQVKPNFDKMTFPQFEEYMKDAQGQSKHRVAAASRHMGIRGQPVDVEQKELMKTKTAPEGSRKRKLVAPAAELQTVGAGTEARPRKKPRVKAHITKEEYLKKH